MAAETLGPRTRTFTVHWSDLAQCIPVGSDVQSMRRRRELFEKIDEDGRGILYQAKAERCLFRLLPLVAGFADLRWIVHKAWAVTREVVKPICSMGVDRMDRNQFRALCIYLWYFFKLWDLVAQLTGSTDGKQVTQQHFEEIVPALLGQWGIQEAAIWKVNLDVVWDLIDRNKRGWVIFDDFAEFILRRSLLQLIAEGEEDSRQEATRLLRRTHPHLLERDFPEKDSFGTNRAAPLVPPPGQWRPPLSLDVKEGGLSPTNRYKTQHMCDYVNPRYVASHNSQATTAASSSSRSALSRSASVASRNSAELETGIALIRSSSLPDVTMRTRGLDRDALRSKLNDQLDMYSTGQMRKLLKVAGGIIVGSA